MIKYITLCFIILGGFFSNAQISLGGKSAVEGTSTILDFNSDLNGNKVTEVGKNLNGIILPAIQQPVFPVTSGVSSPNNGTFIFDNTTSQVKMFENNLWVALSETGNNSQVIANNSNEIAGNQGAIMGDKNSSAKGVLVLESANKGMILPRIANPHSSVKSPYPGMMCYDTVSASLAVFDGTRWNYWK